MALAILNTLFLAFFAISTKKLAIYIYSIVNFMLFLMPYFLGALLGVFHPRYRPQDAESVQTGLAFILVFNIVFFLAFVVLERQMPEVPAMRRLRLRNPFDLPPNIAGIIVFTVATLAISVGAKLILNSLGAFRMLDSTTPSVFLGIYKQIAGFDLLLLAYLGELKAGASRKRAALNLLYLGAFSTTAGIALVSGSRFQVVMCLLLAAVAHRSFLQRHVFATIASLFVIIPNVVVIFPILAYYRNNGYHLAEALERVGSTLGDKPLLLLDVASTRLNYLQTFAMVVGYVKRAGPAGGEIYLMNIIGLIPRMVWPTKPLISNDSHALGHTLSILTPDDRNTSIGLQVIGEAFYELGWAGLFIAVFQGLVFALLQKNLGDERSPMLFSAYIITAIYLVSRDGYFAIVPGLITLCVGLAAFMMLATFCLRFGSGARASTFPRRAV